MAGIHLPENISQSVSLWNPGELLRVQEPQLPDCGLTVLHQLPCDSSLGLLTHFLAQCSYLSNYKGFLFCPEQGDLRIAKGSNKEERALHGSLARARNSVPWLGCWALSTPCSWSRQIYLNYSQSSTSAHKPPADFWACVCSPHTPVPIPRPQNLPASLFHLFNPSVVFRTWWTSHFPENPPYSPLFPADWGQYHPCHQVDCYLLRLFHGLHPCWSPSTLVPGSQQSLQECSWRHDSALVRSNDSTDNGHSPWHVYYPALSFF